MKRLLIALACFSAIQLQAFEYEPQFENDQVAVAKVTIFAHEEIGLHRDPYPEVVIALKGGTITRLEADGSITEVKFPTNAPVFREADPEDEFHKSVNNSSEEIELIVIQLKNSE